MNNERTLLDIAQTNLRNAEALYKCAKETGDEYQLNGAAYFLQQCVELTIKYIIEANGVETPKKHEIQTLISYAYEHNIDLYLTDYIEQNADMFSNWEAKTRYITDYLVNVKLIESALEEIDIFLQTVYENEFVDVNNKGREI